MIRIARMTPTIPRGTIIGERVGGPPLTEAEHFHKCEAGGGWSICAISARCSMNRCPIRPAIKRSSPKKIRPRFPEARSHTACGVHPAVLPTWFHIATTAADVKLLTAARLAICADCGYHRASFQAHA
jgi:hypothetical protein